MYINSLKQFLSTKSNSILVQLVRLAIPVIGSMFMSTAYNFINMIWVGKLGSDAVAAVGTAGLYLHLGWAVSCLITTGAGIKIAHAIGKRNTRLAKSYVKSGIAAITILSVIYFFILIAGKNFLIGFFNLNNPYVEQLSIQYLVLGSISLLFSFQNYFFTNIFTGYGDTRTPFKINFTGLAVNALLDPVLIFMTGWGIRGAAIATIFSQALACLLYYRTLQRVPDLKPGNVLFRKILLKQIIGMSISPTLQRVIFTVIAIVMARIISGWGATAIAVQKVGVQIEALSFMTAGGFSNALSTLSGQAFGAKNYGRQWDGYIAGISISVVIGFITSLLFILFPETLFSIFINDTKSISMGKDYLIILGYSQIFSCIESTATGAFYGWGRTNIPALISISLTAIRIPLALFFINILKTNLTGVWWSISISSIGKGVILSLLFVLLIKTFLKSNEQVSYEK